MPPAHGHRELTASCSFLSRAQVAEELKPSEANVHALIRRGELRHTKVCGRRTSRIERGDLEAYIEPAYAEADRWIQSHPDVDLDPS